MEMKEELQSIFEDIDENKRKIVFPLINEVVFLKNELDRLKKDIEANGLVKYHPTNKALSKSRVEAKLYKEYLQQFTNAEKLLLATLVREEQGEESPLREYFKKLNGGDSV